MRLLRLLPLCALFCICGNALVPAAPQKDISLKEALETDIFSPTCRDMIPAAADKVIGKWSWETAEKDEASADFPTPKNPWRDEAKIKKLIDSIDAFLCGEPKKTKACPAAEVFPGVPTGEVDLLERQVLIDPAIGGWHSLALYAPPGQKITITGAPTGKKEKIKLAARIGCHSDFLTWGHLEKGHHGILKRAPKMCTRINLTERKMELANPFGGLIYIEVQGVYPKGKPIKMTISGGIASPLYTLDVTKKEDWIKQLEGAKSPWGEIQVPRLTFSLPTSYLQSLKVPRKLCKRLQRGMAVQDWIIGWDQFPNQINSPMRFVVDEQISAGYGHSGYPAMGFMDWGNCIKNGSLVKQGSWGLWHELGHNHQWSPFRFDGCGEVTVNIFSTIAQVKGLDVDYSNAWDGGRVAPSEKDLKEYLSSTTTFDECEDPRMKLYFFVELMRGLGYSAFRKTALEYHKKPPEEKTNQANWDFFLVTLSTISEINLTPYFETWKINVSAKAKAKVKKFPVWFPCEDYPNKFPTYETKAPPQKK